MSKTSWLCLDSFYLSLLCEQHKLFWLDTYLFSSPVGIEPLLRKRSFQEWQSYMVCSASMSEGYIDGPIDSYDWTRS